MTTSLPSSKKTTTQQALNTTVASTDLHLSSPSATSSSCCIYDAAQQPANHHGPQQQQQQQQRQRQRQSTTANTTTSRKRERPSTQDNGPAARRDVPHDPDCQPKTCSPSNLNTDTRCGSDSPIPRNDDKEGIFPGNNLSSLARYPTVDRRWKSETATCPRQMRSQNQHNIAEKKVEQCVGRSGGSRKLPKPRKIWRGSSRDSSQPVNHRQERCPRTTNDDGSCPVNKSVSDFTIPSFIYNGVADNHHHHHPSYNAGPSSIERRCHPTATSNSPSVLSRISSASQTAASSIPSFPAGQMFISASNNMSASSPPLSSSFHAGQRTGVGTPSGQPTSCKFNEHNNTTQKPTDLVEQQMAQSWFKPMLNSSNPLVRLSAAGAMAVDASCKRQDTYLQGHVIACFVTGGEKRLCFPQVMNTVLRHIPIEHIEQACKILQIHTQLCTQSQLQVLRFGAVMPPNTVSCSLITQANAERLCHILLYILQRQSLAIAAKLVDAGGDDVIDNGHDDMLSSLSDLTTSDHDCVECCDDGYDDVDVEDSGDHNDSGKCMHVKEEKTDQSSNNISPVSGDSGSGEATSNRKRTKHSGHDQQTTSDQDDTDDLKRMFSLPDHPSAGFKTLPVVHYCAGKVQGTIHFSLYTAPHSACIQCLQCKMMLSPPNFVCHGHKESRKVLLKSHQQDIRTKVGPQLCHWGLDSSKWRLYLCVDRGRARSSHMSYLRGHSRRKIVKDSDESIQHTASAMVEGALRSNDADQTEYNNDHLNNFKDKFTNVDLKPEPCKNSVELPGSNTTLMQKLAMPAWPTPMAVGSVLATVISPSISSSSTALPFLDNPGCQHYIASAPTNTTVSASSSLMWRNMLMDPWNAAVNSAATNPGAIAVDIGFETVHRLIKQSSLSPDEQEPITDELMKLRAICQQSANSVFQANSLLTHSIEQLRSENFQLRKELETNKMSSYNQNNNNNVYSRQRCGSCFYSSGLRIQDCKPSDKIVHHGIRTRNQRHSPFATPNRHQSPANMRSQHHPPATSSFVARAPCDRDSMQNRGPADDVVCSGNDASAELPNIAVCGIMTSNRPSPASGKAAKT